MADCNLLILELKNHEKLEENVDSLISKLHQKGLLHEEVSGTTVHERAEKLVADLNQATSDGYSESFLSDLLEVLETIPAFDDITVKFRTNNTELENPQQETDLGINGVTASDRHLDVLTVGSLPKQDKSPEVFSKVEEERNEPYEGRAGTSGSYPQEESHETVDSLNSKIDALTKEIDKLRLQKDQKDRDIEHLKYKLNTTERRAERAERAERQLKQQEREHQIERSALNNRIQELRKRTYELQFELDEAQQKSLLEKGILTETQEKVANLQMRLNELELEKEESSSPATSPIIQLKLFCKDVEPTAKKLGKGCYGRVFEVKYKGETCAAKVYRDDLEKLNTELGILLQLKHDHIVRYIGFTTLQDSELPVLLMEKLATSLHAHLESKSKCGHVIPLSNKVHILLGVGEGLRYLHKKDVIHRDLTALNVLLDQSNPPIPKIADFGNSHVTSTNPIVERDSSVGFPGTVLYMPPEAYQHNGRHSHKLDIFSFGHLSLFVCTQTFPRDILNSTYTSTRKDGTEKLLARSEVDRRRMYFAKLDDEQYRPLKALMYKCLDNDPAKRPPASEVVCELNEIHGLLECSDNVDYPMDGDDYDMPSQESNDSSLGIK